jgi:hypothetical protein
MPGERIGADCVGQRAGDVDLKAGVHGEQTGVDFILTAGQVKVESATLAFAEKEPLGYVSDHIGLRARLSLTPSR